MKLFPLDLVANTNEFKKIINENPDLPIVVLVENQSVDEESEGQLTYCSDISFCIEEILDCEVPYMKEVETDRDHFDEEIEEWLWEDMTDCDKNVHLSETVFEDALKEIKEKYESYWKKVICIYAKK